MARTWRIDKVIEAFSEPDQALVVHERRCTVLFTFVCTCHPAFVAPPADA